MSFPLVILALVFFAIASGILMRLAVRERSVYPIRCVCVPSLLILPKRPVRRGTRPPGSSCSRAVW